MSQRPSSVCLTAGAKTDHGNVFDEVAGNAAHNLVKVVVVKGGRLRGQPKGQVLVARRVLGVRHKRRVRLAVVELAQEPLILRRVMPV